MEVAILAIPFIGTSLGAFTVFFMKDKINPKTEKILLGFAAGVMIAASVWSLLIPSIDLARQRGKISWVACFNRFCLGHCFSFC